MQAMRKLWITTDKEPDMKPQNKMRPIHPGEVLREEFLAPLQNDSACTRDRAACSRVSR